MVTAERCTLDEELERAFDRKRANFMEDYDLNAKPALIWQARPVDALEFDVSSEKLREAMRGGGGPAADDRWWQGFKMSSQPLLVFDGVASTTDGGGAGWASEIHVDGCLTAGVWVFPESARGSTSPAAGVPDFYVDAFRDFTYLVGRVFEAATASGSILLTATMHQADKLALVTSRGHVVAPAPKRKTLRWPILTVTAAELPRAGSAMAAQFMRAYGRKVPET